MDRGLSTVHSVPAQSGLRPRGAVLSIDVLIGTSPGTGTPHSGRLWVHSQTLLCLRRHLSAKEGPSHGHDRVLAFSPLTLRKDVLKTHCARVS